MTLSELLKDQKLPVRVRRDFWATDLWVEVLGSRGAFCCGFNQDGVSMGYSVLSTAGEDWSLFVEPKKKRILYQALYNQPSGAYISGQLFATEDDAKEHDCDFVRLLKDRPIEVEVEE